MIVRTLMCNIERIIDLIKIFQSIAFKPLVSVLIDDLNISRCDCFKTQKSDHNRIERSDVKSTGYHTCDFYVACDIT